MTTLKFSEFIIELEDRTTPGTFNRPCGLTSKGFKRSANTTESMVPNCDDEALPAELQRGVTALDWSIDGAATIDLDDMDDWEARYSNAEEINVRISRRDIAGTDPINSYVAWIGPALITTFDITAEHGAKAATGSITLTGAGKQTRSTYIHS
jgi:hypothetical protein